MSFLRRSNLGTWTSMILSCHPLLKTCFILFPPAVINYTYLDWSCVFFMQTGWSPTSSPSSLDLHTLPELQELVCCMRRRLEQRVKQSDLIFFIHQSIADDFMSITTYSLVHLSQMTNFTHCEAHFINRMLEGRRGANIVSFWCNVVSFGSNMHCYLVLLKQEILITKGSVMGHTQSSGKETRDMTSELREWSCWHRHLYHLVPRNWWYNFILLALSQNYSHYQS